MLDTMAKKENKPGRPPLGSNKGDSSKSSNRHVNPRESFHLSFRLQAALNNYIKSQDVKLDKSATLRAALKEFLRKRKAWSDEDEQAE